MHFNKSFITLKDTLPLILLIILWFTRSVFGSLILATFWSSFEVFFCEYLYRVWFQKSLVNTTTESHPTERWVCKPLWSVLTYVIHWLWYCTASGSSPSYNDHKENMLNGFRTSTQLHTSTIKDNYWNYLWLRSKWHCKVFVGLKKHIFVPVFSLNFLNQSS